MSQPLMPKATAVWLIDNTALTFEQIADYCGLHALEVQAPRMAKSASVSKASTRSRMPRSPVRSLSAVRPIRRLGSMAKSDLPKPSGKTKGPVPCPPPSVATSRTPSPGL